MDPIVMLDDDDAPQAAAAAKKAPVWPPHGNKDLASWTPVPPWGAHKASAAEVRVKEKYQAYQQASEKDLEKKRDTFLGECQGPRAGQLKNGGPFTFREDAWIQLEAIRRLWVQRTNNSAHWAAAASNQQHWKGDGVGAGAAGATKVGYSVPHPGSNKRRGLQQMLQATAVGNGGVRNAAQAPAPFGAQAVNQAKQRQQAGVGPTLDGVLHRAPLIFAPAREGKSGGGGRLDGDGDGFVSPPGRVTLGNQAPKQGGSGRATRRKKEDQPVECGGCKKVSRDIQFSPAADIWLCRTCIRKIEHDDIKQRPAADDDSDFVEDERPKKAPAPRAAAEAARGKRKAQGPPEVVEILDDDEDAQIARALAASDADAAAKKRPQRKAAQDAMSLSTQLLGLKAFFPSPADPEAVEVSAKDLSYLELGEFLNDTVIDMYLLKIKAGMTEEQRGRCHFFNTFFYKKLTEKDKTPHQSADLGFDRAYDRVKRWTKSIDLLAKDFIVVPIHKELHWSLAIICHPGKPQPKAVVDMVDLTETQSPPAMAQAAQQQPQPPQQPLCPIILHLDSMESGHKTQEVGRMLRAYLHREWQSRQARAAAVKAQAARQPGGQGDLPPPGMDVTDPATDAVLGVGDAATGMVEPSFPEPELPPRDFSAMECVKLQLPQQDNTTDCGCFLLAYVQHFVQALPALVPGITSDMVQALRPVKGEKPRRDGVPLAIAGEDLPCFLGKLWFHQSIGRHMRTLLRIEALQVLVDQGPKPPAGVLAAGDAGTEAGPSGAAGPGQGAVVAVAAPPEIDKRVEYAAAKLNEEKDNAAMVESSLAKQHRDNIAKWRKKAQGGEAEDEVVAVDAGGGKGGRGKGKVASAPTKLKKATLASDSDVEEEQSDVEEDLPDGLTSKGKGGASGKKTTAGGPVQAARARARSAAAAAASRPGDKKGETIIPEGGDGDDEAVRRRCERLRGKAPVSMVDSPYVSDADGEDVPIAKTSLKRVRKKSGEAPAREAEVMVVDDDDSGSGEQPKRKAARPDKRNRVIDDDDDGPSPADGSKYMIGRSHPALAPEGGEEPQRQAHTPDVALAAMPSPPADEDGIVPPGFQDAAAPAPPQVDHLDLTGDDDPFEDKGVPINMVPSDHTAAACAAPNKTQAKKKPSTGGATR